MPVGMLATALTLPLVCGNASRSLRATGASTVEDADFTNSPLSFSQARTVLLSTPSSLASSCTRALPATVLLRPARGSPRDLVLAHDGSHRCVLIACSSQFQLASCSDSVILVLPQAINQFRVPGIPGTGPRWYSPDPRRGARARPTARPRHGPGPRPAARASAAPAGTPGGAPRDRGTSGRDAHARPGPAAACGGRGRGRPRPPRRAAGRLSPPDTGIPHRCVPAPHGAPRTQFNSRSRSNRQPR